MWQIITTYTILHQPTLTSLQLFDDKVIVDYSVLGRAVLGNDTYPMTFKDLWLRCRDNKTLWYCNNLLSKFFYFFI